MTWEKHFVLELFLLSSDIQIKQFGLLVETSQHCCRKAIYVSRIWVWRKPFFLLFSHELFIFSKKVLAFLGKRCSRFFEAASYVSRGAMTWGKHFNLKLFLLYSDFRIKYFGPLMEFFRHCCRKSIYLSRSWVWRKRFFVTFLPWTVHNEQTSFGFFGQTL